MDICLPGAPAAPVLNGARAAASRRNGARSRGPKTPEGKARSAQNALKHGMRAQKCIVLPGERACRLRSLRGGAAGGAGARGRAAGGARAAGRRRELAPRARRAPRGRAVRPEHARRPRPRPRPDPRLQRCARLRHAAALSRRHARRAVARASHPQRPPGRAGGGARARERPHRVCSPSRRKCRSNPSAAEILAIQVDRAIEWTSERPIRVQPPRGCRTGRCPRPAKRRAFSRSNPSGARSRHKRRRQRLRARGSSQAGAQPRCWPGRRSSRSTAAGGPESARGSGGLALGLLARRARGSPAGPDDCPRAAGSRRAAWRPRSPG